MDGPLCLAPPGLAFGTPQTIPASPKAGTSFYSKHQNLGKKFPPSLLLTTHYLLARAQKQLCDMYLGSHIADLFSCRILKKVQKNQIFQFLDNF